MTSLSFAGRDDHIPLRPARMVPSWVRAVGVAGTVLIAAGAFWLSFTALTGLALMAGVPAWQAWAWPVIVDGLIVVATISVVTMTGRRQVWYPWLLLIAAALVSVTGNAVHAVLPAGAVMPSPLAATVAAVPPVVLLAVTHLTAILTRPADAKVPATSGGGAISRNLGTEVTSPQGPPGASPRRTAPRDAGPAIGDPSPLRFLVDYLMRSGGTASAADVIAAAAIQGFTDTQIKDARRRSVRPVIASTKDGVTGGWVWTVESAFEGGTV